MANRKRRTLLIIDPQRGFCDGSMNGGKGELYVPGSEDGIENLSDFIDRNGKHIDIDLTMDCHHRLHIGHPTFWRDAKGQQPPPFTQIKAQDVKDGVWTPRPHGQLKVGGNTFTVAQYAYHYLDSLAKGGRYPHTVWPIHCVIGTEGNNIMPRLANSLWA